MSEGPIREGEARDVPAILDLMRGLAEYEKLPGPDDDVEERFRRHAFGPDPAVRVLVAEADGALTAYALYYYAYSSFLAQPTLHLEDLFVRSDARGAGTGRALLRRLATIAREHDCGRFEWLVLDWNESAIGFYRGLGATVFDDWRLCRVSGEALERLAE